MSLACVGITGRNKQTGTTPNHDRPCQRIARSYLSHSHSLQACKWLMPLSWQLCKPLA